MRSRHPMPGNPWPHDMVISIKDDPQTPMELLFLREAWHLDVPEVPALEQSALIPSIARPTGFSDAELRDRWLADWSAGYKQLSLRRTMNPPDADALARIAATADADLHEVFGRRAHLRVENDDLDALNAWRWSMHSGAHEGRLEDTPERRSLDALIGAWRRGLTTIVPLPFVGEFAETLDRSTLVVSQFTRARPNLFGAALDSH